MNESFEILKSENVESRSLEWLRDNNLFLRQSSIEGFKRIQKIKHFIWDVLHIFVIFAKKHQNLDFGWSAGYSPSSPSISAIFLKFPNFLRSSCFSPLATGEATPKFFFWWKYSSPVSLVLKREKVYKCFVHHCLKIFLLVFTCLKMHWKLQKGSVSSRKK